MSCPVHVTGGAELVESGEFIGSGAPTVDMAVHRSSHEVSSASRYSPARRTRGWGCSPDKGRMTTRPRPPSGFPSKWRNGSRAGSFPSSATMSSWRVVAPAVAVQRRADKVLGVPAPHDHLAAGPDRAVLIASWRRP